MKWIETSSGATSHGSKSIISENSTKQKSGKSKFQLKPKAPPPNTDSSSDIVTMILMIKPEIE